MNYITIVFAGGLLITRKVSDLYSLTNFRDRTGAITPDGSQIILNWDNVLYIREAEDYEIESARHHEEIRRVVQ